MINLKNIIQKKYYETLKEYSFEICKPHDIESVKKFINDYWKKGHAVAVSDKLMDWQYYNPTTQEYNIVIAKHKEGDEIHGIYAFIPVSQFDNKLPQNKDLWLSIWKAKPNTGPPMLGLSLLSYILNKINPGCTIGIMSSDIAKSLFGNIEGFKLGYLNHYYIVNKEKSEFEIMGNFDGKYCKDGYNDDQKTLEEAGLKDLEDPSISPLFESERAPTKSLEYLKNRFLNHPFYDYKIFKVVNSEKIVGLIISRIQDYNNSRVLRIVDYYGNEKNMEGLSNKFQKLLTKYDAEYVDFYNYGFSEEIMAKAGFLKREKDSKVIVPNYFEPFEKKNVDIDFLAKTDIDFSVCKADSEQDRPNIIK